MSKEASPMEFGRPDHLFVVEGDVAFRDMLCCYLEEQGVASTPMASAEEMLRRIHRVRPDLIVLNARLPRMSGLDACRRLRADGDKVPIIFLTPRDEEIDRLLGLEMGADDCLSKPFSARELVARVRAVLRRTAFTPGAPLATGASIPIGACVFQVGQRSLDCGGELRVLSTVEYAMLAELATNAGVPISRERLLAVSHGREQKVSLRAVDAAMVRLRRALEPDPAHPRYIQTVRKHGYVFVPDGIGRRAI
ncbi:response regulator [Variovorax sp. YR566]|uniref:response regulator n=1 Tax=Variovorax sp. YR566 TaxID=3450237 RepID=UPI003F7D23C8